MNRWLGSYLLVGLCIPIGMFGMEVAPRDKKSSTETTVPSPRKKGKIKESDANLTEVVEKVPITSMDDLIKFQLHQKGVHLTDAQYDQLDFDDAFVAKVLLGSVALGTDNLEETAPHVYKELTRTLSTTPAESKLRHKKVIVQQAQKHDGNLSARSIADMKSSRSFSAPTPEPKKEIPADTVRSRGSGSTLQQPKKEADAMRQRGSTISTHSGMETPKRISVTPLNLQMLNDPLLNDLLYDPELAKAKQELRNLMLESAENAIKNSKSEANRNLVIAVLGLIGTVGGPIVTYFTTAAASDDCDCTPPSNGTLT